MFALRREDHVERVVTPLADHVVNDSPAQLVSLGGVTLSVGGEPRLIGRRKPLGLLVYLARTSPRPPSREELVELLWGDRAESAARQSLRHCLAELRAALGGDVLEGDVGAVHLPPAAVTLDATLFEADVAEAAWERAVVRWTGEFLPGLEDIGTASWRDWLDQERALLRRQMSIAIAEATAASEARGDVVAAIEHATRWCTALPTDERGCVRLVTALRTAGRVTEAAARHADFVAALRRDWSTEPSAKLLRIGASLERAAKAERRSSPTDGRAAMAPAMVGRTHAFTVLSDSWARACARDGQAVVIEGDEGIGKTRLCVEFARHVGEEWPRSCVIEVHAAPAERDRPNAVLRPILDRLADSPGLASLAPSTLSMLALISPALGERFRGLPETSGDSPEDGLDDAVTRALLAVAEQTPVLLVVDDAPEADAPSGTVVSRLLGRPPRRTLIVVAGRTGAWRSAARRVDPPLDGENVERIELSSLTPADVAAMLESMVPLASDDARRLGERLHRESGGYPAQAVQLFGRLTERGVVAADATGQWRLTREPGDDDLLLPAAAQATLRQRVQTSSDEASAVAYAAAVLGPRARTETIEAVAGLAPGAFQSALAELLVSRILRAPPGSPAGEAYEFASEANRRLVYDMIAPDQRRALHATALRVLRSAPTAERDAAALAFHERHADVPMWRQPRMAVTLGVAAALTVLAASSRCAGLYP